MDMNNDKINNENLENEAESEQIIMLEDEQGNEVAFNHIDTVVVDGNDYAILAPSEQEDDEEEEILILKMIKKDDEYILEFIEDEQEVEKVFSKFQEEASDRFDFI